MERATSASTSNVLLMKQFLKFTLATIVGVIIAWLLAILVFFIVVGVIAGSADKAVTLKPNSVYEIDLKGQLIDRSENDPLTTAFNNAAGRKSDTALGLDDLLSNIKKAKDDQNIVGIYLKGGSMMAGMASVRELRNALLDFKKSGKFVVAYADNYTQKMYYLVSVADKILINPQGMLDFKGLSAQVMFFKNTLDKLGVQVQVVRVGAFKSAVEPFINTRMSDANKLQVNVYLNSVWKTMLNEISASRKIPVDSLNHFADEMMMFQPTQKTQQCRLVDSLVYIDRVDTIIKNYVKKRAAIKSDDDWNIVTNSSMCKVQEPVKYDKNKIAIIYAVGDITDDEGDGIVATDMVKTINDAAADSAVKAVVFRVNSPGGSAYASEQIWHALSLLKKHKPLIVSMGDYAASGGYYISCVADEIVAQPNTLTGSIGIFGLIPNIKGLNEKLGLTYDGVKTNAMSDAISINRPFTPEEKDLMQNYINRGYELFVKRCADGRHKTTDQIKAIAGGRVWTGSDALQIGLVDKLGDMKDAVRLAGVKAKIKTYNIVEYPEKEDFATKLMKNLTDGAESRIMKMQLGEQYLLLKQLRKIEKLNGIQTRLPFDLIIQ